MRVLSQGSYVVSFVLVSSVFNSLSPAKISVQIPTAAIDQVLQKTVIPTGESTASNVFGVLLAFYTANPTVFQDISKIYNDFKGGVIDTPNIPADIYSKIPSNVASILCVKNGNEYQINPAVSSTLDLLLESIKDGIDAAKSKTCKACCQKFWCSTAPKFLCMTAELLGPILLQIAAAKASTIKDEVSQNITIQIPERAVSYAKLGR